MLQETAYHFQVFIATILFIKWDPQYCWFLNLCLKIMHLQYIQMLKFKDWQQSFVFSIIPKWIYHFLALLLYQSFISKSFLILILILIFQLSYFILPIMQFLIYIFLFLKFDLLFSITYSCLLFPWYILLPFIFLHRIFFLYPYI